MDAERDSSPVPAGAAAVGFAPAEGGGFGIALDDPNLFQVGAAVPAVNWPGPRPCWRVENRLRRLRQSCASRRQRAAHDRAPRRLGGAVARFRKAFGRRQRGAGRRGRQGRAGDPRRRRRCRPAHRPAGRNRRADAAHPSTGAHDPARTVQYRRHPELAGDALRSVVPCRLFPLGRGRAQLSALEAGAGDRDPGQHQSGFDDHLILQGARQGAASTRIAAQKRPVL